MVLVYIRILQEMAQLKEQRSGQMGGGEMNSWNQVIKHTIELHSAINKPLSNTVSDKFTLEQL